MAYLQNCLPIQKYESEEFPGDGFFVTNNEMEVQNIPSDIQSDIQNTLSTFSTFGQYLLVIEAMPGFNIQASMINIGGVYGDANTANSIVPTWEWGPNTLQPTTSALPTIMQGVDECNIKMVNSNIDNPSSCSNKVYVRVQMPFEFQMPAYDVTVNIDFGGAALQCETNVTISEGIQFSYLNYSLVIGNGQNANPDCQLFIAKYYESEAYAASIHDMYNQNAQYNAGLETDNIILYVPTYDPTGEWLASNPTFWTGSPSALQSFQPTYYNVKRNTGPNYALWNLSNDNNITNECGQLIYQLNGSFGQQNQLPIEHPNYDENPRFIIGRMNYKYRFYPNDLNPDQYPYLTPGDGILPSSLCWYISVGNNPNYELFPEGVDVYKIISALGYYNNFGWLETSPCPEPGVAYEQILVSEMQNGSEVQNNSHLDITNIQCVPVAGSNNKTVKLTINFQNNYQENIWTPTSNMAPNGPIPSYMTANDHRILINVYPNQI